MMVGKRWFWRKNITQTGSIHSFRRQCWVPNTSAALWHDSDIQRHILSTTAFAHFRNFIWGHCIHSHVALHSPWLCDHSTSLYPTYSMTVFHTSSWFFVHTPPFVLECLSFLTSNRPLIPMSSIHYTCMYVCLCIFCKVLTVATGRVGCLFSCISIVLYLYLCCDIV